MRKLTLTAVVLGLFMSPALAQTVVPDTETKPAGQETNRAECLQNFRTADADSNGMLSVDELENARDVIPTQLGLSGPISESEYMAACTDNLTEGG